MSSLEVEELGLGFLCCWLEDLDLFDGVFKDEELGFHILPAGKLELVIFVAVLHFLVSLFQILKGDPLPFHWLFGLASGSLGSSLLQRRVALFWWMLLESILGYFCLLRVACSSFGSAREKLTFCEAGAWNSSSLLS